MTPVRLEPAAPRSRVKHSTIEPLRSLFTILTIYLFIYLFLLTVWTQIRPNTINLVMILDQPLVITQVVRASDQCSKGLRRKICLLAWPCHTIHVHTPVCYKSTLLFAKTYDLFRITILYILLSRDMRFPTMWHFDMCRLRRACAASF